MSDWILYIFLSVVMSAVCFFLGRYSRKKKQPHSRKEKENSTRSLIRLHKLTSVEAIAAGMVHEIKNPIGGILQGIQIAKQRLDPKLPKNHSIAQQMDLDLEKVKQYLKTRKFLMSLDIIWDSGNRATHIVNQMLQFIRPQESQESWLNVNDILDNSLELAAKDYDLKKKFKFNNIKIVKQYDNHLSKISCFESELQLIFLNIIKNAAQALHSNQTNDFKPTITIKTQLQQNESHLSIEIADNGPGIPESIEHQLFEPGFTTAESEERLGLGLFVCHEWVVKNYQGTISVRSEPGKDTIFTIRLPLKR